MKRRNFLAGTAAALATPALAQGKPEKLIYVGDNGPWHYVLVEEVAPAFEKETGIKIDFTLLPVDAWNARLKAELNSGSSGISRNSRSKLAFPYMVCSVPRFQKPLFSFFPS